MKEHQSIDGEDLKQYLSAKLYDALIDFHGMCEQQTDAKIATEVVITALSINLGHIVGQLPKRSRNKALKSVKRILDEQVSTAAKMTDIETYGQVGHA